MRNTCRFYDLSYLLSEHGKHYLRCAEDWFGELESDHLINGSIPTVNHPLYAAIKVDHLELYRLLDNKKKLKKLVQFYTVLYILSHCRRSK